MHRCSVNSGLSLHSRAPGETARDSPLRHPGLPSFGPPGDLLGDTFRGHLRSGAIAMVYRCAPAATLTSGLGTMVGPGQKIRLPPQSVEHVAHMRASFVTSVVAHVALLLWCFVSIADPKPFDVAAVEPMTVDLVPTAQVDQPANPIPRSTIDSARPSPMPDRKPEPDNKQSRKGNSISAALQQTRLNETKTKSSVDAPPVGELVVGPQVAESLPRRLNRSASRARLRARQAFPWRRSPHSRCRCKDVGTRRLACPTSRNCMS